jgi:beta-N-acetylhexosaminidase
VILFSRNVATPEQVAGLITSIKAYAGRPVIVGVDQEGGRVARLREGFTAIPSMREIGERGDAEKALAIGAVIGREMRAVGIDVVFAPVLDVDSNPANPVIGDRSLGPDPAVVAKLGVELARGIESAGVAACGKHFPGHGDTHQDSHLTLPTLVHDMRRLNAVELVPFRAAIADGIAAIMTSHIVFEALDNQRPATISPELIAGLLRETMGYCGVVFTDCMEMKAIAAGVGTVQASLMAMQAGVDMVLISHRHDLANDAIDRLEMAIERGDLDAATLDASSARIRELSDRFVREAQLTPNLGSLACVEHRRVVASFAPASSTSDPTEPG